MRANQRLHHTITHASKSTSPSICQLSAVAERVNACGVLTGQSTLWEFGSQTVAAIRTLIWPQPQQKLAATVALINAVRGNQRC